MDCSLNVMFAVVTSCRVLLQGVALIGVALTGVALDILAIVSGIGSSRRWIFDRYC